MRYLIVILLCMEGFAPLAQRTITSLDIGWKFSKGYHDQASTPNFDDRSWTDVTVPHDWGVDGAFIRTGDANTGKLPWKDEAWYRNRFVLSPDQEGRRVYLLFDGVMAFPAVFINGELAGKWDYGYNSFFLDITEYVIFGAEENVLAVHVDTRPHDSRWYPGAGIYRKIQMIIVHPIHVDIWGTQITTPLVKSHYADIRIAAGIIHATQKGDQAKHTKPAANTIKVKHTIFNREGGKIADQESILQLTSPRHVSEATLTIPNPKRWDTESPYLYSVITELYQNDLLIDSYTSTFGVRTVRFTANDGFFLNDKRVQLKGVNLHHDLGPLGTAFNSRAMQRQLEIMKGMGCNAIRTSHNIAAPELLDLCDEMGLLVFNEIFDKYDGKADITDTTDFEAFAHRNIRNFIRRDRNHPCVFLWSVGNEIGDVQWNKNNGFRKLQTMLNYVEKYDNTRPVTLVCDNQQSAQLRHFDYYDVHCWNYGRRYALARQLEPTKAVIISESASTVSTRGFYEFPLPAAKTDFTNSLQISSYDLHAPEWAEIADDDFMWQQEEPYVAGEFVWTGFDYLGEPTPYDNRGVRAWGMTDENASRSSYFGIVDLCGIPKDRYFLYKSYWKPQETTIHILPHWNWEQRIGQNVPVFVYTNGDCAELFLNGISQGMRCKNPKSKNSTERFRLMWSEVIYTPGELKAVAYKEGAKLGEQTMRTTDAPTALRLTADRAVIQADGKDLSFVLVEAIDQHGYVNPLADNTVSLSVDGAGSIAGVDNGNPQSMSPFKSDRVHLFYGKAMVIVQSAVMPGEIRLVATSTGLKSGEARISCR